MSLDNFFDEIEMLGKKKLVVLPCSFVETQKVMKVTLPKEYAALVERYYPDHTIFGSESTIEVMKW